ncbi:hypothetical protein K466DRAFT_591251 [Polyporus arcularius HHB13444]|uniref:Uncharacterized protein n=1 Tax=Polyporus arcularius HHB13444 TaxID=1314778 RepID=A0A5C3NVU0_9APHY|nr:hypothetical protein K466DRAFT_591251 [Polyporus arcularius HHB13444]
MLSSLIPIPCTTWLHIPSTLGPPGALGIPMDDFLNVSNVTVFPAGVSQFTLDTKVEALLPDVRKLEDDLLSQTTNVWNLLSNGSGLR